MKRNILIGGGIAMIILALSLYFGFREKDGKTQIKVPISQGYFEASISATGELQAKESKEILGPSGLRVAGLWQVQITDIVDEGTQVEAGQYVATLDRTEASSKLKDLTAELEKSKSQLMQTKLDTTLELREVRDQLINLKYAMEESQLTLEQSKFEPPAIIRQAEITYEKSERAYQQAVKNYAIKKKQAVARISEIEATVAVHKGKINELVKLLDKFIVKAPMDGMVIYKRDWRGRKKSVGANISPWDLEVATLPDLSSMISVTYINEVDISRVQVGQNVKIGIDAFPEKEFEGKVISVANVGEQRPNSDSKVFEVKVLVEGSDTTLRPSMTTSNIIVTSIVKDGLFVATETLHANDSMEYVFKAKGSKVVKQEVISSLFNENETIIEAGLSKGDQVYLSVPDNHKELEIVLLSEEERNLAETRMEADYKKRQELAQVRKREIEKILGTDNKRSFAEDAAMMTSN